jgi:hypothetical protein
LSSVVDLESGIKEIEHLLSRPTATPNEFSTWIVNWLAANMDISTYQLRGLASTFFKAAPVQAAVVSTAVTPPGVDLGGPILTGLSNGRWLAFWGANFGTTSTDTVGLMGISPNGGSPSDTHAAKSRVTAPAEWVPCIYSRAFDLDGSDQNYLQARYMRVSGTNPKWWNRWLVAVKVAK